MRSLTRRLVAICGIACALACSAQGFPTRPIRLVVPYVAGGPTDTIARAVAQEMASTLGQPLVVENKPGADSTIGTDTVARAPADGHVIMLTTSGLAITATLYPGLGFEAARDFSGIGMVGSQYLVLVTQPALKAGSLDAFTHQLKAHPETFNYGTSGSTISLVTELFHRSAGLRGGTRVPYRGNGPMMNGFFSGELHYAFVSLDSAVPYIQAGKLHALAVTSPRRDAALPAVPSLKEAGLGDAAVGVWYAMLAPRGTPPAVIDRLNGALIAALSSPRVIEASSRFPGFVLSGPTTPPSTDEFVRVEIVRWGNLVRSTGLKPD